MNVYRESPSRLLAERALVTDVEQETLERALTAPMPEWRDDGGPRMYYRPLALPTYTRHPPVSVPE